MHHICLQVFFYWMQMWLSGCLIAASLNESWRGRGRGRRRERFTETGQLSTTLSSWKTSEAISSPSHGPSSSRERGQETTDCDNIIHTILWVADLIMYVLARNYTRAVNIGFSCCVLPNFEFGGFNLLGLHRHSEGRPTNDVEMTQELTAKNISSSPESSEG